MSILLTEYLLRLFKAFRKHVNLAFLVVEIERRPACVADPHPFHQRHGAVVPAPYGYPVFIDNRCDVVRMDAAKRERDNAYPVSAFPENPELGYSGKHVHGAARELLLVHEYLIHSYATEIIDCGAQSHGSGYIGGPRLE